MHGSPRIPLVLIVDDNDGDLKQVHRLLCRSPLDCNTATARSVDEATGRFDAQDVDFIFLDYGLPGHDGIESITRFRRLWPSVAIAVMTGQGDEEIAAAAIKAGATDYIPKRNMTPEALQRIVKTGLEVTRLHLKLDTQREELDTFAHTLAHDLKAPLRALDYFTEALAESLDNHDMASARDDRAEIAALVARLNRTIDDLSLHLQFDPEFRHSEEDAADLVRAAMANLHAMIAERGATLHLRPLPRILCSRTEIIQLFQNLIGNGIKYCPDRAPVIRIETEAGPDGHWTFSVRDNGMGVPRQHAGRIFQPFQRLHREEDIQGTGLGLSTCQKIVTRHGGRIWCESRDTGTSIRFTLPAAEAGAEAFNPPAPSGTPPASGSASGAA